jgi:uncharacterized protein with HEPN domain
MKDPQRLADYVDHIIEAIRRISNYCEDVDEISFLSNQLIQDAVIRNFEVIGEASNNIARLFPEFISQYPDLPLIDAYEMRNALAHGYFKVDLKIVWLTVQSHLPALFDALVLIKAKL